MRETEQETTTIKKWNMMKEEKEEPQEGRQRNETTFQERRANLHFLSSHSSFLFDDDFWMTETDSLGGHLFQ